MKKALALVLALALALSLVACGGEMCIRDRYRNGCSA